MLWTADYSLQVSPYRKKTGLEESWLKELDYASQKSVQVLQTFFAELIWLPGDDDFLIAGMA